MAAEPEADASVLYGGYAYGYPAAYGYGAYGYGYPAYGAYGYGGHYLGKRDADASVLAYTTPYVYAPQYYYPGQSYQYQSTPFHTSAVSQIHKREAEPQGVAVHPGLATSSTFRSVQGAAGLSLYPNAYGYPYNYHLIGKREAEADASVLAYTTPFAYAPYYHYPGQSYQYQSTPFATSAISQIHKREAEPQGVAVHPGLATSSTYRSVQGAPGYSLYPYAYASYPYAYGYY